MKKVFNIIKNILIFCLITILLFVLFIVIYSFVQMDIQGKEYCNLFGYSIFQIETGSMSGTLEIEDIIIVKLESDNLNRDDIITFRQDGNLVTHRIIEINDDTIITKGDSNTDSDKPITKEDVVGKVIKIFPEIAIWKKVVSDVKVLISLGITILLLILLVAYKEKTGERDV